MVVRVADWSAEGASVEEVVAKIRSHTKRSPSFKVFSVPLVRKGGGCRGHVCIGSYQYRIVKACSIDFCAKDFGVVRVSQHYRASCVDTLGHA